MEKLKFMTKFPYLIEYEPSKYIGILHLKMESIGIQLICPEFPSAVDSEIKITRNNKEEAFSIENCGTVFELMEEIENSYETQEPSREEDIATYNAIFQQLKSVKDEHRFELSKDYKTVKFPDIPNHPGHYLELTFDAQRKSFLLHRHSLPKKYPFAAKGRTLGELLSQFKAELTNLDEFYGNISDIDELCFVIAPVPVNTKDCYRIFKFNEKVFIKVTLDPFVPSNVQLNFIGPLEEVEPLRNIYCEKIDDWDVDSSAHKNLLRMFDLLFFPYRPDCNPLDVDNHRSCSICFEFNLNDTYPIITCFNRKCEVIFHAICLQKWFDTLTDTRTFCTVTSGNCPYCKQKLTMYIDIKDAANE